jgi:CRP-like cAMP-binding protein
MSQQGESTKLGAMSLAGIQLLQHLSEADRAAIEARAIFRRFSAGEMMVARYSAGNSIYFILEGTGRVVHFLPGEDEITIATVTAGDTIGEIAAIDGKGRSATIIADEDCTVAELPRPDFRAIVARHGEVALALLVRWAAVIRELDDKFSYVSTISPDQRVYSQIIRLARQEQPGNGLWVVRDLPDHQDLAEWAQTSRESVASAIAELYRRGIAERRHKSLIIKDYPMLKSLLMSARADGPS